MARESWETMINAGTFSATETGTELKESAVRTAISPGVLTAGKVLTIPAGFFRAGHMMRITAGGVLGTAKAENSINLSPIYCTGVQTAAEGKFLFVEAQTLIKLAEGTGAVARKKFGWKYESLSRCVVGGSAAKFISSATLVIADAATKFGASFAFPTAESTVLGEGEAWDNSLEGKLAFGWKWTTSSAEDFVQQTVWVVEILN